MALRRKIFAAYRRRDAPFAASTGREEDRSSCRTPFGFARNAKVCFASGGVGLNVGYPTHELLGLKVRRNFPPQFELTVRLMQINERSLDPTSQWVASQKGELPWASSAKTSRRWTIFSCTACRIFIMPKIRSLKPCPR